MSKTKPLQPQSTDDFILNPFTKRLIRKDSKTYKRLVNAKLLDVPHKSIKQARDDNLIIKADTPDEAKKLQSRISKGSIGPTQHISRRNDKIIKCNRKPSQTQTIDKVSDIAVSTMMEHKQNIMDQDMDDDEMDAYIRRMIQLKLIGHDSPVKKSKKPQPPPPNSESDNDEY
jgi:hypothetical protein